MNEERYKVSDKRKLKKNKISHLCIYFIITNKKFIAE